MISTSVRQKTTKKRGKTVQKERIRELYGTLDSLQMIAEDIIDEVVSIRLELEQMFEKIEQEVDL